MPVTLGATPQAGFDQPLGLLSDCHRRIEHFLGVLARVARDAQGAPLEEPQRQAVEACLHYFAHAAPRHNADEEQSLFPRLRELAESDSQVRLAMEKLDALEADHQAADAALAEVREWFERWMETGTLAPSQVNRLIGVLELLEDLYRRHIDVEDNEVFRLAGRVLQAEKLQEIGREMAHRRGLEPRRVSA